MHGYPTTERSHHECVGIHPQTRTLTQELTPTHQTNPHSLLTNSQTPQRRPHCIQLAPHRQAHTHQRTHRLTHREAVRQTKQNMRHLEVRLGSRDLLLLLGDLGIEVRSRHRLQLLDLSTAMLTAWIRPPHRTQFLQRSSDRQNDSTHWDMHAHTGLGAQTSTSAFLASSQRCRLEGEHEGLSLVSACFFRLLVARHNAFPGQRTPECRHPELSLPNPPRASSQGDYEAGELASIESQATISTRGEGERTCRSRGRPDNPRARSGHRA
jgi:hypothetical protein